MGYFDITPTPAYTAFNEDGELTHEAVFKFGAKAVYKMGLLYHIDGVNTESVAAAADSVAMHDIYDVTEENYEEVVQGMLVFLDVGGVKERRSAYDLMEMFVGIARSKYETERVATTAKVVVKEEREREEGVVEYGRLMQMGWAHMGRMQAAQ